MDKARRKAYLGKQYTINLKIVFGTKITQKVRLKIVRICVKSTANKMYSITSGFRNNPLALLARTARFVIIVRNS